MASITAPECMEEEWTFDNYIPITTSVGPWAMITTVIVGGLGFVALPFLHHFGKKRRRKRRAIAAREAEEDQQDGNDNAVEVDTRGMKKLQNNGEGQINPPDMASVSDAQSVQSTSTLGSAVARIFLDGSPLGGEIKRPRQNIVEKRMRWLSKVEPNACPTRDSVIGRNMMVSYDPDDGDDGGDDGDDDGSDGRSSLGSVDPQDEENRGRKKRRRLTGIKSIIRRKFEVLLDVAAIDYETKRIYKLAIPFVSENIILFVFELIWVGLIGNYIGTEALIIFALTESMVGLSATFLDGITDSLTTICSHAIGAENPKLAGEYLLLSTTITFLAYIPVIIFWLHFMGPLFLWFGYCEQMANLATVYLQIAFIEDVVAIFSGAPHYLLDIIGYEVYSTILTLVDEFVETVVFVVWCLYGNPTILQVAWMFVGFEIFGLLFNICFLWWRGWLAPYYGGMFNWRAYKNMRAIKKIFEIGLPLSAGSLLAYGEWELMTFFARYLGNAEVAAWVLLATVWEGMEGVVEAVSDAAEVRVAYLLGAGKPNHAKQSAYKCIFISFVFSLTITSIIFICGADLPMWLTKDQTLQRLVGELIPLVGIGEIALLMGSMAWTIVGAQGRWRLATIVGSCGMLVSIPLAAVSCIVFKWDLRAQTASIVIGYIVSGNMNIFIMMQSDWDELSSGIVAYNEANPLPDDSSSSDSDDSSNSSESEDVETSKKTGL